MNLIHSHQLQLFRRVGLAVCAAAFGLFAVTGCNEAGHKEAGHAEHAGEEAEHAEGPPPAYVDTALGEDPAFEWMGVFPLPAGTVDLVFQPGPDGTMNLAIIPLMGEGEAGIAAAVATAKRVGEGKAVPTEPGTTLAPGKNFYALNVEGTGEMRFPVNVPAAGKYALFTQHFADEFQTLFQTKDSVQAAVEAQRIFKDRFGQIAISPEAIETFGVQLAAAKTHELTPSFIVPARVAYNAEAVAHVGTAVSGRLADLKVRQGDVVKKGDVLIVVDSPELGEAQSDLIQKRTAVATAAPALELAQSAYDRAKTLYDKNKGIALTEVQKRQAEYQGAQGALATAKSAMTAAENKLHLLGMDQPAVNAMAKSGEIDPKYTIRAPIAGQVTRRDVTLGELVRPDMPSLLVVADMSTVWVLAEVPEAKLADAAVGSPATVTVAALRNEKFEGVVSFVSPELDPSTRTVRVRIEVKNPAGHLKPGMFAQAEISQPKSATTQAALAVPDTAVQTIEGKPVVFVPMADKTNTFLKRPVTLESAVGSYWPVRYGLKEGEVIVTDATFLLKAELGKSGAKHDH